MKSFAILRTNVGLTSNIKIMVESNYELNLESIDSNQNLSATRFKKVKFNKRNYLDELISYFYKDFPSEKAFDIKYEGDNSTMIDSYEYQYDEIYQYGARNIINNKNYLEEYEYFAPLYINPKSLPKKFIIFRVDGPGIEILTKNNFKQSISNKFKTVKIFDLEKTSPLGEWLETNYVNNQFFPPTPLEFDFRNLEFCKWNGIDYERGGYTSKSVFMDDIIDEEKEIFRLEKLIFDYYKENKIVFPNILNFSFLFDDTPSTPEMARKWTINRYFGFYVDEMILVQTISPYITPFLRSDVVIQSGNIIYSPSNEDPFVEGFSTSRPFYVEYLGNYYIVEKFAEEGETTLQQTSSNGFIDETYKKSYKIKYRIISDIDLTGKESELNKNYGTIDENGILKDYFSNNLIINEFDSADVWLIEINGIFHNLVKYDNDIKVITDYSFEFSENFYKYKVGGNEFRISFVVDYENEPKKFNIYKLNFTDIKDFDDRIIDTEYSKFEYEKKWDLTLTDETKMYVENYSTQTNPKELDDFIFNNEVVNIPVSSEYTCNLETYKIENDDLTSLWRKNSIHCRWGYQNSLSANDVPYLLNNSLIFEDYNRTTNPFDPEPKRIERNLDYFYTLNSSTSSYIHHTLHVEKNINGNIDTNFIFDMDKYLNLGTYSFDYFTSFFERSAHFDLSNIKKNVKKYSQFNIGDTSIPNITLFRGIEFRLFDVESIKLKSATEIDSINVKSSNEFEDYKFSILLAENKKTYLKTDCFDLNIEKVILETACYGSSGGPYEKENCALTWDEGNPFYSGTYFSEDLTLIKYVGWYLNIGGTVSTYKVIAQNISDYYAFLMIEDESTGLPAEKLSLCEVCFSRVENRIIIPEEKLENLLPGDQIEITSSCYTGTYSIYEDSYYPWNFQNTIALDDDPQTAPIYLVYTFGIYTTEYELIRSNTLYQNKYYYTISSPVFPSDITMLWDASDNKWKLWNSFVGGTPTGQLAFLNGAIDYPIGTWTTVSPSLYTLTSEFRSKPLSTSCSGTICLIDTSTNNMLEWEIIEEWQMDKEYATSSIVIFEDILYQSNTYVSEVSSQQPTIDFNSKKLKSAPYNLNEWNYFIPNENIFWSPTSSYSSGDFVFNSGEYYYLNNSLGEDFWNPEIAKQITGYNLGDIVLFKGNWYESMTSSNNYSPDYTIQISQNSNFSNFWTKTNEPTNPKWKPIEIWNPSFNYNLSAPKLIVHEDIVYTSDITLSYPLIIESESIPGLSIYWKRLYSMEADTNFVYDFNSNPILSMNNRYYLCKSNSTNSTLENGIKIYINRRWKNVLVNIEINDNTYPNIKNAERDKLYTDLYSKLTAYNFIQSINNLTNKYGFSDYVKYIIIDELGNISNYSLDNNLINLPYLLKCEVPDELRVKLNSLDKKIKEVPSEVKAIKVLNNSTIIHENELNYYSDIPIAYTITENKFKPKVYENLYSIKNFEVDVIYRFTGYYMPLFYDIQIFEKNFEYSLPGNYKFDTELTEFGIMKERKSRKVNESGSVLKLKDLKDYNSIYPMLDEFGYSFEDFLIFRSTWDMQYHRQTVLNKPNLIFSMENTSLNIGIQLTNIGSPLQNINQNFNL